MSFPPHFLDQIRDRVPVSDVVGRRVQLRKQGREQAGLCPFHNEKTPSFTVSDDKGFYHCFGCGAHGDVISFVMNTEGLSFPEAVEKLAGEAGLQVPKQSPQERERAERAKSLYDVNEAAAAFFELQLKSAAGRDGRDYLLGRGFSEATIAAFRLGFAPDGRELLKQHLLAKGFEEAMLLEAGVIVRPEDGRASYDRFRGRVIFPIADRRGRIIAFGGRILGDGKPKYLNSAETPLFHKGRQLYALDMARQGAAEGQPVIVAEGYTDVIALHQAGLIGAVAPLGTALTENQIEELWRLTGEPILCFDGDEAGRRAAARAAERALPLLQPGKSLRFALLPPGEDPDSLIQTGGPRAMREACARARPLVDMIWEMETAGRPKDTPERRAAIRKALRERAFAIAERGVQQDYLDEFDARLNKAFGRGERRGWHGGGQSNRGGRGGWDRRDRFGRFQNMSPDSGLRASGDVGIIARRRIQALLATVVNHPDIVDSVAEDFGRVELPGDLDKFRQAVLSCWSPGLDSSELQNHLIKLGFSAVLEGVLAREVYEFAPAAKPDTEIDVALAGWRTMFASATQPGALDRDVAAAQRALEADVSDRTWAQFNAVAGERRAMGRDNDGE